MLGLISILSVATANDILLPHFTPTSLEDIGIAERFENSLLQEIQKTEVSVVSPTVLESEFPNIATSCAENPTCPAELLSRDGASLLLVGTIETSSDGYNVMVYFHGKNDKTSPLEVKAKKDLTEGEMSRVR